MGPTAGLERCGKSVPTGIRFPDRPARTQSLYRLSYPTHYCCIFRLQIQLLSVYCINKKLILPILSLKCNIFKYRSINPLTPNDPYRGRTAPLTSKVALYIFIQQIWVLKILNMVYTLRFSLFKMQFVS